MILEESFGEWAVEAAGWKFEQAPDPFAVREREVEFAVVLVMAGDGDLESATLPDIAEMALGTSPSIGVLVLRDLTDEGGEVIEVTPNSSRPLERWDEVCTGDPRPLADFFARALVSYGEKTRFALGFWGHGSGVFDDEDDDERVLPLSFREAVLGEPITEETWSRFSTFEVHQSIALMSRLVRKPGLKRSFLPDMTSENKLTNQELTSALLVAFARARRGEPVDMVFFDTCLAGSVEVFCQVRRFARTVVASALPIPGDGWDYREWLSRTGAERPAEPRDWARLAVEAFEKTYDQRGGGREAQIAAWDTGVDFVAAFYRLLDAILEDCDVEGIFTTLEVTLECRPVVLGQNIDFGEMMRALRARLGREALCDEVISLYEEARIALSMAPAFRESLTGMTICGLFRDGRSRASDSYLFMEFNLLTKWFQFLVSPGVPLMGGFGFSVRAMREGEVVERLSLPSYVPLRELVRCLEGVSPDFAVLGGCWEGREFSAAECEGLARAFQEHRAALKRDRALELELCWGLEVLFQEGARGGSVVVGVSPSDRFIEEMERLRSPEC